MQAGGGEVTTIRFHLARWYPRPSREDPETGRYIYGTYQKICVVCGKTVGSEVPLPMLDELTVYQAEDGCCYHEKKE